MCVCVFTKVEMGLNRDRQDLAHTLSCSTSKDIKALMDGAWEDG